MALAAVAFVGVVQPGAAPAAAAVAAQPVRAAVVLPPEFKAIRPAGLDGEAPSIPPSELWPAQ